MLLKTKGNLFHSFSFRLTVWYAILFITSLIIIFFISYKILLSDLVHVVDRGLLAETTSVENEFYKDGLDKVKSDIRESIEEEGKNKIFYRLLSSNLNILATSDPLKWPCLNFPQMSKWASMAAGSNTIYQTLSPPDRNFKIRIISRGIFGGKYIVQIGKTMRDEEELVGVYKKVFGGAVLVLLLCGIVLAWIEAQRAMRGVKRVTHMARNIGYNGICDRVQSQGEGEEIDDLAQTFNTMLDRIEDLMRGLKDVTNNIAHDLRTPITRIRGLAETTLGKDQSIENFQESVGNIVEECDRLVVMINTMLEIAEADAGLKKIDKAPVDIVALVKKGGDIFLPVAQDKGIHLDFKSSSDRLVVMGEPMRLQRVISNLLDNAIKFTAQGGDIRVEIEKKGTDAIIFIKDTGIGIDESHKTRIFEKFYRIESSRSAPGNGLGLSYVQSIVSSMGGTVEVESILARGSIFIVKLPLQ